MIRPFHIALLALALLAGSSGYVTHQYLSRTDSGPPEPTATVIAAGAAATPFDWSFTDLHGERIPLERWRGRLLVVNFWATWCSPCLREIPTFIDLQTRYGDRGLQFVGIALDQSEAVAPFVTDQAMNYPVLIGEDDVVRFMQSLGNSIGGLPYTAVIGADGAVLLTHQGEWPAEAAENALIAFLSAD